LKLSQSLGLKTLPLSFSLRTVSHMRAKHARLTDWVSGRIRLEVPTLRTCKQSEPGVSEAYQARLWWEGKH
jgi:hypothetical protein